MNQHSVLELKEGRSYLVEEAHSEIGYKLFEKIVADNERGLLVSRQHPSHLEKRFKNTRFIWVSQTPGKDYYDPTALTSLAKLICQFVEEKEKCVVLLDCFEFLTIHNDFEHTFKMLELVNEFIMQREAILIVTLNPEALNPQEVSLLEKGMEVIRSGHARSAMLAEDISELMERY